MCPTVTAEALFNHLNNNVHRIAVKKLKVRGNNSRFYVDVVDVDYDNDVIHDDLWEVDLRFRTSGTPYEIHR